MNLRFSNTEAAFDYMAANREYLEQHGKLTAFYSDRHAVSYVNDGINRANKTLQDHRLKKVGLYGTNSPYSPDFTEPTCCIQKNTSDELKYLCLAGSQLLRTRKIKSDNVIQSSVDVQSDKLC